MEVRNATVALNEANGFYKAAKGGFEGNKKFSDDLVFSILTMAIEKYLVSYLLAHNILPEGHTINGLLEEVEKIHRLDTSMKNTFSQVDEYMYLCSLEAYKSKTPDKQVMTELLHQVTKLKEIVTLNLK